jgi:hypothetical protein
MNPISKKVIICLLLLFLMNLLHEALGQPGISGMSGFMRGRPAAMQRPITPRSLRHIAYGNDTFAAIGPGLTILSSKDGTNWINCSSEVKNVTANINFTTDAYSNDGDAITYVTGKLLPEPPKLLKLPSSSETETNFAAIDAIMESNGIALSNFSSKLPQTPHQLRAIAFGGGFFVIVGDDGEILTSPDGEHWTTPNSGTSVILTGVVWGSSGFVAIGDAGTILTSPDGSIWTKRNSGIKQTLFGVAFGNNTFVVVGDGGTMLTSSDGIEWTPTNINPQDMSAIAFGNGIFLGTSTDSDFPGKMYLDNDQTMTSTDGKIWHTVAHPYPPPGQTGVMTFDGHSGGTTSVNFGGELFIATSVAGIFTSKDGNSWIPSSEPHDFKSCYYGAAFGNNIFIAVGNGNATGTNHLDRISWSTIATSQDAKSWLVGRSPTPPSRLLEGFFTNEKNFRITSHNPLGLFPNQLVSTDGETWTTPDKAEIDGTIHGNQVGFSYGKKPVILASKDGIVWTRLKPNNSEQPTLVTAANNIQAASPSEGSVMINLNGQAYNLDIAVNVGKPMEIQASTNLMDWITLTTITNAGGTINFTDPDTTKYPMRFYRLKAP